MNKTLIIGIAVFIVIGIAFGIMQMNDNDRNDIVIEQTGDEPKRIIVGLSESLGVTEKDP